MILLDAYALVAFLAGGSAAAEVRAILRRDRAAVTTANLAEALEVSERVKGVAVARSMEFLEPLLDGPLATIPLDTVIAVRAAQLRARHYRKTARPISLADAVLLATAGPADTIATSDPHVLAVAHAEKLKSHPLPEES